MALIGAHVSVAGGIPTCLDRGKEMKCEAVQIFLQSGRTWKRRKFPAEEIAEFHAKRKTSGIRSVVAHNSYLLNLTTSDKNLRKASIRYFIELMGDIEAFEIDGIITHPGSHGGKGEEEGIRNTIDSFNEVLRVTKGMKTIILIENTAGQGACLGHDFFHLKAILDGIAEPERVGFCFDTQHAFAAGYDLRTRDSYEEVFGKWENEIGLKKIKAFHLNDALKGLGSRVDRHENIGKGFLGKDPFNWLVNDPRFKGIPMCLETLPGESERNHKREIKLLQRFRSN